MATISTFKLQGLVPACFTPMKDNGDVDFERIEAYSHYLRVNGIKQIYLNGTTAEGFSLTVEERKKIAEEWVKVGRDSGHVEHVVVHVGALNLHDTQELALHAAAIGADAIASVPPLFFKPQNIQYLVQYCKDVAGVVPHLPFYYYHLPGATGVEPCIEDFLKAAVKEIPSLVGVKFSSKDLVDLVGSVHVTATHRENGRLNLMYGCDEMLIGGLLMGALGSVGSCCNFMPEVFKRMLKNAEDGDKDGARLEQYRIQQTCKIMFRYGALLGNNVAALKCIMKMIGLDLGPPRPPLRPATEEELASYKADLTEIGFFDWTK